MKKLTSLALCTLILTGNTMMMTSCSDGTGQIPLNEITYVAEDTPWYDMVKVEMDFEAYGTGFVEPGILLYNDDYFTSIVSGWVRQGDDVNCIEQRDYDGNLLCKINIQEQLDDSYSSYVERADGYTDDGKDYIALTVCDAETWEPHAITYEIDYANARLINPHEIDIPGMIGQGFKLCEVSLSGDYIVYRTQNFDLECRMLVVNKVSGESYVAQMDPGDHSFFYVRTANTPGSKWEGDIFYTVDRESDSVCYSFNPDTGVVSETVTQCELYGDQLLPDGTMISIHGSSLTRSVIGSNSEEDVMNLANSAISPANYVYMEIGAYTEDHIVFLCQDISNSQGYQTRFYYILNKAAANPHAGKQIVTIADFIGVSTEIGQLIEKNNGSDSDYYIVISDKYNWWNYVDNSLVDEERYESMRQARLLVQDMLIRDVANGEGPDVLIGFGSVCAYTPNLVYADLTPFIDGEDGLARDEFIDVVFTCYGDDIIYQIPFGVQINGLEVPANLADDNLNLENMTYSDYVDFINYHHDGEDAIFAQDTSFGYPPTDLEYFMKLWKQQTSDYIDDNQFNITTGDNAESFRALAEFAANRDVLYSEAEESGRYIGVKECHYVSFYYYYKASYGREHNIVGYPSFYGATPYTDTDMKNIAMTLCCSDKNAAWNVIRQIFDYDIQSTFMDNYIPVNIQALEYVCDRTIELINDGTNTNVQEDFIWDYSDTDFSVWKNQFIEEVMGMSTMTIEDQMVNLILREELPAYFEGQKSIEDVAAIIENRVNNYLQEVG